LPLPIDDRAIIKGNALECKFWPARARQEEVDRRCLKILKRVDTAKVVVYNSGTDNGPEDWMTRMKRKRALSCVLVAVGVLVLCLVVGVLIGLVRLKTDRTSCNGVLWAFAQAMRRNESERARSYASPDQWDRIDAWMAGREGVACSLSLDSFEPDHNGGWFVGSTCADMPGMRCTEFGFMCSYRDGVYHLSIDGAVLHRGDAGCVVMNWEQICESGRGDGKIVCK
jgi:hypothetical protein